MEANNKEGNHLQSLYIERLMKWLMILKFSAWTTNSVNNCFSMKWVVIPESLLMDDRCREKTFKFKFSLLVNSWQINELILTIYASLSILYAI